MMKSKPMRPGRWAWLSIAVFAATAHAAGGHHAAPYRGQENRAIKALSAADVESLEEGRGWGLAKPAELNGYPGPLHVLELADDLQLTEEQTGHVELVFERMKRSAQAAGAAYLDAERALDDLFASDAATPELVERLAREAGHARAELQAVHLIAHLETRPLLTERQRHLYTRLRGYGGASTAHHGGHAQRQ